MTPTATATAIAAELAALDPDQVLALVIPHQRQDDRARAISHFGDVIAELRSDGWQLDTGTRPTPDGLVLWVAAIASPTKET